MRGLVACGKCQTVLMEITDRGIKMKEDAAIRKADKPEDGIIKCSKCAAETTVPGLMDEMKRF
jgi:hypothetical protein